MTDDWGVRLQEEVIDAGLCTQCGTCVGLSDGALTFELQDDGVQLPVRADPDASVPSAAFEGCPARYCHYPALNRFSFGRLPDNWLAGVVEQAYVGHATDEGMRRAAASGGVISRTLVHLLETGAIEGAVCLRLGETVPYEAEPVIAETREEILDCAQSVYSHTPVNTVLDELAAFEGPVAFVGLPDQVASIRKLQRIDHPSVANVEYVLGPYMGTQMHFEAIRSFLRANDVDDVDRITNLDYRAGEWPGSLRIDLDDGRTLTAAKFYYNYLIPFYITRSSLQLPDFTNELTDISVGDAWSPEYEERGGGHSVVLARTPDAVEVLESMADAGLLDLSPIDLSEALDMHGHMLDFKKRGSFIRNGWRDVQPEYGYRPARIPRSRVAVEWCLRLFFGIGRNRLARRAVEHVPLSIIGPTFNWIRKRWKGVSKPTKREGLREMDFEIAEEE